MITDTNGGIFERGKYTFRVVDIPMEVDVKGYKAWQWSFEADTEDGPLPYQERFMVWLVGPLLRALGCKEITPGKFDWNPTDVFGRAVNAEIIHVTLDKGPSAGKTVARMKDIQPATGKMAPEYRAAMQAQAPAPADTDIPF